MFNYEYETYIEKYPSTNNELRQLLSSIWLAKKSAEDSNLLQLHRINLDFIFRNWYEENGDLGYIYFQEKSKIGSIGMALRLIVASPCFEEYKDKALNLANTILALQNEDGSLKPWYIEPEYSFDEDELLYFYSGQAILSLIELYEKTGDDRYLDAAILSQDYYINEYVTNIDTNYYPGYVPWHTMSLYKLYTATKSDKYADAIFIMNDKLIEMQNHDGRPYMDLLGQFYDPVHPEYGVPFSGSTGVDLDGLINAYKIAAVRNDYERMYEYKKAIFLGAHNLINLQFKGADMYYLSHPERVWGAIRFNADDNRIRVDATQHMADAFIGIMETFFNQ
jgi:hypothetical protein